MTKKTAQGLAPDPRSTQVDVGQLFPGEEYNLAEENPEAIPREDMNSLRDDWIDARIKGQPLYVVAEDGRMFYVAVGGDGKAITLHSVVPRYEIQEGTMMEYAGPDAFFTLEEHLGRYQVIPMNPIEDSSVEAHIAAVRDPIWFKAVRYLVNKHVNEMDNPYK
jgi:hypothetical protein